jgi:phosphopantothenoylcysteine decarboxylase/phosphopantothenate--cysteine ligase, prokaryotic
MNLRSIKGKTIVLAVTGSIAAVETIKLVHALRRKGATVQGVMSQAACGIIHPDALTYATGRPVITRISGMVEHVLFCGDGGCADLLLIAPCTANTIGKITAGIDDTPVTTFATTALGRGMPVVIVPAMHHSMYRHPAITESIQKLRGWGVTVTDPRIEEGKAKISDTPEIILACERELFKKPLAGRHVLITSGPCREPLDDVRVLTTRSTGLMGRALALWAWRLGARVTVVHADSFPVVNNIRVSSASDMREAVLNICSNEQVDLYISAAAISDFAPEYFSGKIESGKTIDMRLNPLPKLLPEVTGRYGIPAVGFKLGWNELEKARKMVRDGIMMVVVNTPGAMGSFENSVLLIDAFEEKVIEGPKEDVAGMIWEVLLHHPGFRTGGQE